MAIDDILRKVASGELSVEEAERLFRELPTVLEIITAFAKQARIEVVVYPFEQTVPWLYGADLDEDDVMKLLQFQVDLVATEDGYSVIEDGEVIDTDVDLIRSVKEAGSGCVKIAIGGREELHSPGFWGTSSHDIFVRVSAALFPEDADLSTE